jgi:hypothetical protein
MNNPYNRNNLTLFNLPEFLWNPNYQGIPDYHCWSVHTWVRDNRFLPSYQVWINYKFQPDPRGLMRAQVKNIWERSHKIEIYCKGIKLEGDELKSAKYEIRQRLKLRLKYHSLRNKYIRRYVFNYVASFTEAELSTFDCHHLSHDNAEMRKIAERNGMQISEQWLLATDDRVNNLEHLSRIEHKLIHFANGDTGFLPYTTIENSITLTYEIAEVCGDANKISSSDGYEVNKGNDRVSAISNSDNLKQLWELFCELGFNDLEQRRYANLLTQT